MAVLMWPMPPSPYDFPLEGNKGVVELAQLRTALRERVANR